MMQGSTMIVESPHQVTGCSLDIVEQVDKMSGVVASLVRFGRQVDPIQYVSSMMNPRVGLDLQRNKTCLYPV